MTSQILVVEELGDTSLDKLGCHLVHIDEYLTSKKYFALKNVQLINLCSKYSYSSIGYYCSLLAEARGHKVIPSVRHMLDLSNKSMYSLDMVNLDEAVKKAFDKSPQQQDKVFRITVMFGHCVEPEFNTLARRLFETFTFPIIQVSFKYLDQWRITTIRSVSYKRLDKHAKEYFKTCLEKYSTKRWAKPKSRAHGRYDLAILHNPNDPLPPSNNKAIKAFIKAGKSLGIDVDLIQKNDYSRLAEYDALFIRDTTRIDHYTYRFAKKAESEGLVVIDDPSSILRCTNKVYLAELLRANKVPTPQSAILGKNDLDATEAAIAYPMVLKVPDGAFSLGVFKAENRGELEAITERLFKRSELVLAQEYLYTQYDWRIGILNRKPIFACQYFMYKKHWQIVKHGGEGSFKEGASKTWPVAEAPKQVINAAVKAAGLIGDGLYGVDIKQTDNDVFVIEVNDNPNIDAGVEDGYLGRDLFIMIMAEFRRRLDSR